jgi:DNA polymerase alpha-associated DNA helicase A
MAPFHHVTTIFIYFGFQATEKPPHELTPLMQVLLGIVPPSAAVPVDKLAFFDESLNASQKAAVRFALESPEVACIHGPPG